MPSSSVFIELKGARDLSIVQCPLCKKASNVNIFLLMIFNFGALIKINMYPFALLKSVYFKKTVARISSFSKLWHFLF